MKKTMLALALAGVLGGAAPASAAVESWYTYWALGFSSNTYEEPLNSTVQWFDSLPGIQRTQVALDMFGFYWPLSNDHTLLGVVVSGTGDRLGDNYGNYIQLNQYLYGASAMHFFGDEPGDGFYVRGDIGAAQLVLASSSSTPVSSDTGSGVLLGIGYGVPVSEETRLLIGLSFSSKNIEGHAYQSAALTVGGLW